MLTIMFEDHGQDFLEWDVKDGEVEACRPFQEWFWVGARIPTDYIEPGCRLPVLTKDGRKLTLKYAVAKVFELGNCSGCHFHKGMANKAKGVRIPGRYGKCIRPQGHCDPGAPRTGL